MNTDKYESMRADIVYLLYVKKLERKGYPSTDVISIISWFTGFKENKLKAMLKNPLTFKKLFEKAPHLNEKRHQIKGVICGIRVETIENPLIQNIRVLDKLIDERYKGKSLETLFF